jgi:hypothetical protein
MAAQVNRLREYFNIKDSLKGILMATKHIYRSRVPAVFLIPLGVFMLCLSAALPFELQDPILGFILMGLPLIFTGSVALLHGCAAAVTRIEITEHELKLSVPGWRGFPVPPLRRASLGWSEVLAVRHRTEIYRVAILPFALDMPFPVDVFAIDTSRERFILGGRSVRRLTEAIAEIAARSGRPLQSEQKVWAGLVGTLLRGAPPWQQASPGKRTEPAGN